MFHLSLAAARVNAGMKQKDVAEIMGVHTNTIINWENGLVQIPAEQIMKLSEIYNVPLEYLISKKEIMNGFSRISVTTDDNELIADITAENVICKSGYKVRCME